MIKLFILFSPAVRKCWFLGIYLKSIKTRLSRTLYPAEIHNLFTVAKVPPVAITSSTIITEPEPF